MAFRFIVGSDRYVSPSTTRAKGRQDLGSAAARISGEHRRLPDVVQTQVQEYHALEAHTAAAVRGTTMPAHSLWENVMRTKESERRTAQTYQGRDGNGREGGRGTFTVLT